MELSNERVKKRPGKLIDDEDESSKEVAEVLSFSNDKKRNSNNINDGYQKSVHFGDLKNDTTKQLEFNKLLASLSGIGEVFSPNTGKIRPHVDHSESVDDLKKTYEEFEQVADSDILYVQSDIEWSDKACIEGLDTYKYPSKEQLVHLCILVMRFIFTGTKPSNLMTPMLLTMSLLGCDPNDINQHAFKKLFSEHGTKDLPYLNDLVKLALSITDSQEVLGENYPGTGRINAAKLSSDYNYKISCYYYLECENDKLFKMLVARLSHICLFFCRLSVKNISSVKYAFPKKSHNLFKSIYKSLSFSCPPIQIHQNVWTCLEADMMNFRFFSITLIKQICREITNETGEPNDSEFQIKKYFESSCLQQLYCNGMPIFTLPIVIANKYKVRYRKVAGLFLATVEHCAVQDITRMLKWLKSNKSQTWPFARLINDRSFTFLSAKRNPGVHAKLLALLDDDDTQPQDSIFSKVVLNKKYVNEDTRLWAYAARIVLRRYATEEAETLEGNNEVGKTQRTLDLGRFEHFLEESIIKDILTSI